MATKEFVFINGFKHDLYKPEVFTEEEILSQSRSFYERMDKRRSVREFADTPVPSRNN